MIMMFCPEEEIADAHWLIDIADALLTHYGRGAQWRPHEPDNPDWETFGQVFFNLLGMVPRPRASMTVNIAAIDLYGFGTDAYHDCLPWKELQHRLLLVREEMESYARQQRRLL